MSTVTNPDAEREQQERAAAEERAMQERDGTTKKSNAEGALKTARDAVRAAVENIRKLSRDPSRTVFGAADVERLSADGTPDEAMAAAAQAQSVASAAGAEEVSAGAGRIAEELVSMGSGDKARGEDKPLDISLAMLGQLSPTMVFSAAKVQEVFAAKKDENQIT